MMKTTKKEIRRLEGVFNDAAEVWARVKKYQEEKKTTGMPSARSINLERIAYSSGTYGCSGVVFQDIETGDIYASANRDYLIYIY